MSTATIGGIGVRCGTAGDTLRLVPGSELGAGGQATVYPVPGRADRVAKVYHQPAPEQELKLRQMLARRPAGASTGVEGGIFAWPLDLLRDGGGRFAGVLLPRVDGKLRVFELYNPATRRERAPLFHHGLLHRAARNLASAFHELHEVGFVVGDVNESNVLVGGDGGVVLIDTDSFQVRDPVSGVVFRCPVGRPEFTPPELRGCSFTEVDRAPEHDRFGLGVLVFQMLMEGTHPFAGRWRGEGEPPPVEERIAAGHYPYGLRAAGVLEPPRTAPPLEMLGPGVRDLLRRCFEDGHPDPAARPHAAEWRDTLAAAEAALAACGRNQQHRFGAHLGDCPWCERARRLEGRDPFPSAAAVRRGEHRPARPRASRHLRLPAAPRPRSRAGVNRTVGSRAKRFLSAPAMDALLGTMLVLAPLVAIIMGIPAVPAVLAVGGLLVASRRMVIPGTPAQWAVAATVLVLLVLPETDAPPGGPRGIAPPRAGLEPPTDGPPVQPVLQLPGISSGGFAYAPEALDRRPVLQDTAALLAAIASLPVVRSPGAEEPGTTLRFVLDSWGQVDSETVRLTPDPGTYALGVFRARLEPVEFRPGEMGGRFVRTEVRVTLRRTGGGMSPDLASASWNPGMEGGSPPADTPAEPPAGDVADAGVEPWLLNAGEVQALLAETYPPLLRDAGVAGRAEIELLVDARGAVVPASIVVVSATHEAFAGASATVAAKMRFSPAMVEGEDVPMHVRIPLSWTLERD